MGDGSARVDRNFTYFHQTSAILVSPTIIFGSTKVDEMLPQVVKLGTEVNLMSLSYNGKYQNLLSFKSQFDSV